MYLLPTDHKKNLKCCDFGVQCQATYASVSPYEVTLYRLNQNFSVLESRLSYTAM